MHLLKHKNIWIEDLLESTMIKYDASRAGDGKTTRSIQEIRQNPNVPTIYCCPSKALCLEIMKNHSDIDWQLYTMDTVGLRCSVSGSLQKYLERTPNHPPILCTHEGFKHFTDWTLFQNETLYFDEDFDPSLLVSLQFDDNFKIGTREMCLNLLKEMSTMEDGNENLLVDKRYTSKIHFKPKLGVHCRINSIALGKSNDAFESLFHEIATHLINPNYDVWCLRTDYEDFCSGLKSRIHFSADFCLTKSFSSFKSVTVLSAYFTQTMMYSRLNSEVELTPTTGSKWSEHSNKINIHYCFDKELWSRSYMNQSGHLNEYLRKSSNITGENTLIQSNKDVAFPKALSSSTVIPSNCHGLNNYSSHQNVILSGAYNLSPDFIRLYRTRFDDASEAKREIDQLVKDRQTLGAYQALMRSAIRTGSNNVTVCVPTSGMAKHLKDFFPNANLIPMKGFKEKKEAMTSTERKQKQRKRALIKDSVDKCHETSKGST
jgi:hypothetical protein